MPIDPSSISNIGANIPSVAGATARGYQLADIINKQQIGQMQLQTERQNAQDVQTLRDMAQKFDLSKPEDQARFSAEAIKISPQLGLQAQKAFTEAQTGQNELMKSQYELQAKKFDLFSNAVAPIYMQYQNLQAQGRTPQEIDAALLPMVTQTLNTMKDQTLPNGKPVMSPEELQRAAAGLQEGNLGPKLDQWMMASENTRKLIEQRLKPQQGKTVQMVGPEGAGVYQLDPRTGKPTRIGGLPPTAAERGVGVGGLDEDTSSMLAAQMIEGTPPRDVLAGLTAKDRAKVQNQVTQQMKEAGFTPASIVAKRMALRATQKAVDAAGAQGGRVSTGLMEIKEFAPLAKEASRNVPRSSFVPYNKLVQLGERNLSDPNLAKLYSFTTSVLNAYDVIAARGGTDVAKREHAREMLSTAMNQETYNAALDTMVQEAEAAERAAQQAMQPGVYNPALSPTAPGASSPPTTPPGAGAGTAPAAPAFSEGATAVNKQTGERLIFKGGQWQPVQ